MEERSPPRRVRLLTLLAVVEVQAVAHEEFMQRSRSSVAIVRTGEFTPYANVILVAGVVF